MSISYTQAHLDALKEALLTGASEVRVGDRTIKYRSQKELRELITLVENYLNASTPTVSTTQATFSKGRS